MFKPKIFPFETKYIVVELDISSEPSQDDEDVLSQVVKRQEAALKKLEVKHGAGYGKPPAGSKSEARAKRYNENCVRDFSHYY